MERTKVITSRRKREISRLMVITCSAIVSFFIGRFSTPAKVETVAKIETLSAANHTSKDLLDTDIVYLDIPLSHTLQDYIAEVCTDEGVPQSLVYAMIERESEFQPEIISSTDDYGLMQINAVNKARLKSEYHSADLLNPYQNVFCGVKIIAQLLDKYSGDYNKALMAYNMGDYGASKAWEQGINSTSYSESILNLREEYEELLNE